MKPKSPLLVFGLILALFAFGGCTLLLGEKDLPPFDPNLGADASSEGGGGDGGGGPAVGEGSTDSALPVDGSADAQGAVDARPDVTVAADGGGGADSADVDASVDATGNDDVTPVDGGMAGPCDYHYSYMSTINGCEVRCDALGFYVIIQTGSSGGFCSFAGPATSCFGCYATAPDGAVSDQWYESPDAACSATNARAIGALCGW